MFDVRFVDDAVFPATKAVQGRAAGHRRLFRATKRAFDLVFSVLLLPVVLGCALFLLILNPFYNRGPLFYVQSRMGRNCKAFQAIKFRSMRVAPKVERGADAPLETDRITRLGGFLRKSRIDELPQIINVLRGDMSLIGPRPDYYDHAVQYLELVPGYRERHIVRPGVSGLAQTELGYAEGFEATRSGARA
ncbi:sugar transferase [Maliponia aquimaris]|uniref:UDP-N-acetylgalactosamine-undecaprenyl-phosphate N-acetylgalactosaminephosphotransferase n=1 Tax=Maliponia aquimaris TaxID=1673631 RepID=A0A238K8S8_9RHOB|nr:sugar transferase [Maliponia aquimaris]SMX38844.1 UDP-N-acetylgalactosamine-undecaprenyl-phosphate N-acetylgalactosaminephosphotransferase [Maliponia aquimaris]